MRSFTASVIIAALSLGTPAFVQAQGAPPQSRAETPSTESGTVIRSIQVVDVKELQPAVRSKIDEIVANTSEEDIQSLRKSIDSTPEAKSVLEAKGLQSSQVVAINIADTDVPSHCDEVQVDRLRCNNSPSDCPARWIRPVNSVFDYVFTALLLNLDGIAVDLHVNRGISAGRFDLQISHGANH